MPPRSLRLRALIGLVVFSMLLQAGGLSPVPVVAAHTTRNPEGAQSPADPTGELDSIRQPAPELSVRPAWVPVTFDNFNRTVADGWGSGWGKWSFCGTGELSVDGQAGHIKTAASGKCIAFREFGPWTQPSWTMTARFKTPADLAGPTLSFDLITSGIGNIPGFPYDMYVAMAFTTSRVVIGAEGGFGDFEPFTWQPDTWYSVKWLHAWGNQSRAKVWPAVNTEPTDWLVTRNATQDTRQQSENRALQIALVESVAGSMEAQVDDIVFSEAPVLPTVPPPPATEDNPPSGDQETAGDPVNTFTGTFSDTHVDVSIPGRGPAIEFARSYNSNDTRATTMGPGWTHSYATRLVSPSQGSEDVVLIGPMGRSDLYTFANGVFTPPTGVHRTLVRNADESYTATDKDQSTWLFDMTGRLTQIRDRYGNASNLIYNASGQLASISDPAGRGLLTLTYTTGKLTAVTDWASPARVATLQYDTNGRLWKVTDRETKTTTYTYDGTSHRLATVTNARGKVALTNTYDAEGRVATQKDARGASTGEAMTFDYVVNPDGTRVTTSTAPPTSFEPSFHPTMVDTYDADGRLTTRATSPSSTEALTTSYSYDAAGNRTSITDARGNRTDYCYDVDYSGAPIAGGDGDLTRVIDPAPTAGANRPVALTKFDANNNVIQTVAPNGVPSGQSVTCASDLSAINSLHATNSVYDATGVKLLSVTASFTDPDLGVKTAVTKLEYEDAANPGRVTRTIPPRGNTTPTPDYTYATTMTYNTTGTQAGLLKDVTDPLGSKSSFAYDSVGRLISSVDPLGNAAGGIAAEHTTTTTYDNEDRVRFLKLPAPKAGGAQLVTEARYDEVGNAIVRIDANGQVTKSAFDDRNSLFQMLESAATWTDPAAPPAQVITTEYTRDAGGNPTRIARAIGDAQNERVVDYVYDGRGLPRSETQYPAWPATTGALVTAYSYDAAGNQAIVIDPLGETMTVGYDASGRRTSLGYSDPATPDVTYQYDANGNRTTMIDGTGTTTYVFDEANRPVSVTSPGPKTVGYRYDLDGHRTKLIYPDATAVNHVFDKAGQLSSLSDWGARSTSYTYWPDSVVKTATNPDGSVATYTYDNAHRLTDILHRRPGAVPLDRFFYTLDSVGNVMTVADGSLDPQFSRPDGLVSSNGTWTGTFASINEATPNDATFLASPSGPTTSNFYEVSLTDVDVPGVLTGITFRYRYAKSGNNSGKITNLAVELRQGTTVIASQSHTNIPGVDGSGWQQGSVTLTAPQAALITNFADLRLRFRPSSSGGGQTRTAQVSWAETQLAGAGHTSSLITYGYDRLYRLTSAADTTGSRNYTYDPVGNRLTRVAGATTAYTYDRADRITAAGVTAITVDANGNLTAKGANTFDFDQANRLASASVAGATETYSYDGDGRRFSRQIGTGPTTRYVFDGSGNLAVTLDDGSRKYVYGLGLAYSVAGTAIEVYHTDRLGSVRALTDSAGVVTNTYRTDEWGTPTSTTGSSTQPFKFTGEPRDATGLTYLRTRYYDSDLGRFLSRDTWPGAPVAPQSQNRYTYASNNPTTYADPSGRFIDTVLDVVFIAVDVAGLLFGPEKDREGNLLALAADVASAFIPFVTGGGVAVRAGRQAIEHADEVVGPIKYLDEFAGAACSFTPGTLVATPNGPVPISTIEVGDIVLAWDEVTGLTVERPVTAVLAHPDDEIARLSVDGVVVTTTPDHPFFTTEAGWVEAGRLWPGAHIKSTTGTSVVGGVTTIPYSGTLWNLTVDSAHTFFVGTGRWLVHNSCPVWKPPAGSFAGRKAMDDAARHFGVDRRALGDYVEELKGGMGRRGDQNVTITPDGDIVMPETGESLGSVFDLLGG